MLFVFLVDDDVEMKSSILGPSKDDSSNFPFQATCLDGALYFVEYFSKALFGGSGRVADESVSQRSKVASHHRTVLFTFRCEEGAEQLELKSTWKDHPANLFEAIKNASFEGRRKGRGKAAALATASEKSIHHVAGKFEDFMEKFTVSYFSCTSRNNGYFIWNEPESISVFCLSSSRTKLDIFHAKFTSSWQRKNVFIHVNPFSFCHEMIIATDATPRDFYAYFPVPSIRDAHQLGAALFRASTIDNFDAIGMELLGKGSWCEFVTHRSRPEDGHYTGLGLLKSCFPGHSRWPVPIPLTEADCCSEIPKLLVQPGASRTLPAVEFDVYVAFAPHLAHMLSASMGDSQLDLFVESQLFGPCLVGFVEAFEEEAAGKALSLDAKRLVRVYIGPMAFDRLNAVFAGTLDLGAYLRSIPQFYEHFLRSSMGEAKWISLCDGMAKSFQRSDFALPQSFSDRKNAFNRSASKHKAKTELTLAVERADAANRMNSAKRNAELSIRLIPPLERLAGDANILYRLLNRFKLAQGVFEASCRSGNADSEQTLSSTLFKHCVTTQQMTDYTEGMRKRKQLRPLFTEQEHDLFLILKENPFLQEELSTVQFVSGDIFGNPFKKEQQRRGSKNPRPKRISGEAEEVVDEIDVRALEDVKTDIVIDGQIVNLPAIPEEERTRQVDGTLSVDLYIVEDLIRSPGGSKARHELSRALGQIFDAKTLESLLLLSRRYKRKQLEPLIRQRLDSLVQ